MRGTSTFACVLLLIEPGAAMAAVSLGAPAADESEELSMFAAVANHVRSPNSGIALCINLRVGGFPFDPVDAARDAVRSARAEHAEGFGALSRALAGPGVHWARTERILDPDALRATMRIQGGRRVERCPRSLQMSFVRAIRGRSAALVTSVVGDPCGRDDVIYALRRRDGSWEVSGSHSIGHVAPAACLPAFLESPGLQGEFLLVE